MLELEIECTETRVTLSEEMTLAYFTLVLETIKERNKSI